MQRMRENETPCFVGFSCYCCVETENRVRMRRGDKLGQNGDVERATTRKEPMGVVVVVVVGGDASPVLMGLGFSGTGPLGVGGVWVSFSLARAKRPDKGKRERRDKRCGDALRGGLCWASLAGTALWPPPPWPESVRGWLQRATATSGLRSNTYLVAQRKAEAGLNYLHWGAH